MLLTPLLQVTSDFLVSRPFCGQRCLARYKGRWSRVEVRLGGFNTQLFSLFSVLLSYNDAP